MSKLVSVVVAVLAIAQCLLMTGCGGTKSWRGDIEVALDQALIEKNSSVQVHVIAPPKSEESRWDATNIRDYWAPNNPIRESSKDRIKEFRFGAGDTGAKRLSENDPIWKQWSGAEHIYIIANLPDAIPGPALRGDPACVILPLDAAWWPEVRLIKVRARRGEITLDTPMTPPATKK